MPEGVYMRTFQKPAAGQMAFFPNPRRDLLDTPLLLKDVIWTDGRMMTVRGRHPKSFDSRVYGNVTTDDAFKAIKIWTRNEEKR